MPATSMARAGSYASTLVNHYAIEFDGPARGGFGDIAATTLVVHGDHDPLLPLPHGKALRLRRRAEPLQRAAASGC